MSSSASSRNIIPIMDRQKASFHSDKPWLDPCYHSNGAIMKPEELEESLEEPEEHIDKEILNRVQGSMIGMALGDAVGAHVEFRPQQFLAENPVKDLRGGGTWGLKTGQFTDDTSMALCLANSLVVCRDFIPYDQLVRYKWWYKCGYMSSTGKCFDIGAATKQALDRFERRQKEFSNEHSIPLDTMDFLSSYSILNHFDVYCSEEGAAGNGALMRLAPVPLFFYGFPENAVEFSGISGKITHGDKVAYDACRYYGALIVAAIQGAKKPDLLDDDFYAKHKEWFNNEGLHSDIMKIAKGSYRRKGGHNEGIRGKGYIVSSLEAALWAFWSDNDSFETGVLAAVNLGDDTDTTAAIYGQLAGAYYGYKNLPEKWLHRTYARGFIECLSKWIVYEGNRWKPENPLTKQFIYTTTQAQSKTTVNRSSEQNSKSNKNIPSLRSDSQQGFETLPKRNQKSATKPKSAHQLISEKDQDIRYRSSTTTAPSNNNDNNGARALKNCFEVKHTTNYGSASSKPTYCIHLHPEQPQISAATPSPCYFHNGLKTYEDVLQWLQSVDKRFENYADNSKKNKVDGIRLLNDVDEGTLIQYGITNQIQRQSIMQLINDVKNQVSEGIFTKTTR